jgi:diadenosine tetraphosphate (Ap4A) HIT family hydrolase
MENFKIIAPKDQKIQEEDLDDSEYDLILKGKKNATILFEDEKCMAFKETDLSVAQIHFIVVPKN